MITEKAIKEIEKLKMDITLLKEEDNYFTKKMSGADRFSFDLYRMGRNKVKNKISRTEDKEIQLVIGR